MKICYVYTDIALHYSQCRGNTNFRIQVEIYHMPTDHFLIQYEYLCSCIDPRWISLGYDTVNIVISEAYPANWGQSA